MRNVEKCCGCQGKTYQSSKNQSKVAKLIGGNLKPSSSSSHQRGDGCHPIPSHPMHSHAAGWRRCAKSFALNFWLTIIPSIVPLQNLKDQILTTNVWLEHVSINRIGHGHIDGHCTTNTLFSLCLSTHRTTHRPTGMAGL